MHRLLSTIYAASPQPAAQAPPGSAGFTTLLAWLLWIAAVALTAAVVWAGIKLGFAGGRHGGGEHGMALLAALAGAIICAVAGTIVYDVAGI